MRVASPSHDAEQLTASRKSCATLTPMSSTHKLSEGYPEFTASMLSIQTSRTHLTTRTTVASKQTVNRSSAVQ